MNRAGKYDSMMGNAMCASHDSTNAARSAARPAAWLLGALLAAAFAAQPVGAQSIFGLFGEEKPAVEPKLPATLPVPASQSMIEFYVSPTTTNRFAIDGATLAIDQERLVRFALVVTSSSGARNVSYEALRCDRGDRRLLAVGRADGSWSMMPDSTWRPINQGDAVNRQHIELYSRLCEGGAAAATTPERLVARLRAAPRLDP
ncbi:MAG: CNP1-like family protein [Burkholderiaceae bacterium]|nr:CNP1-like family protein [Burkholderiaceae bacterium]